MLKQDTTFVSDDTHVSHLHKVKSTSADKTSTTLADQILVQIQTSIIKGELPAGSKINEQALAEKYGISRGPTREALQTLERQRLVVRAPHVGARVAQLTVSELNDLYQLRSVLEGMACELAASRITPEQLAKLEDLLATQEAALAKGDTYFKKKAMSTSTTKLFKPAATSICRKPWSAVCITCYGCTATSAPIKIAP